MTPDRLHRMVSRAVPAGVERWPVVDEASWHTMRGQDVTASVAGALLGVHEYTTLYDLWHQKAGNLPSSVLNTPQIRRGRLLEDDALEVINDDHKDDGWLVIPCGFYYRHAGFRLGATPDAIAFDPLRTGFGIIQIKSVEPSVFREKWQGGEGDPIPPSWIAIQAVQEAWLTGASWAAVGPVQVGHGIECPVIPIPIHEGILTRLQRASPKFWASIAAGRAPRPDYGADAATIVALNPSSNGREIDLSGSNELPVLADRLATLMAAVKTAEDEIKAIKARFRDEIGAYDSARLADGRRVTLREVERRAFTVEPGTYRTLRFGRPS